MKFETRECPLCGEVLRFGKIAGVSSYYCKNVGTPGGNNKTHYEVEIDTKESLQHIYVFPYSIDNVASSGRTRVYKWKDARWRFIKEVQRIHILAHEELYQHLHLHYHHE